MTAPLFTHILFGERRELPLDLPPEAAARAFDRVALTERARAFQRVPLDDILGVVERAGRLMADPGGPYHKTIMERMPEVANYSPAMVEQAMALFRVMTGADFLLQRLRCLGDPRALDHFVHARHGTLQRAIPMGVVCHIAAGNVFLGSVDSLLYGLATKNVNILKCSRQDLEFPSLFFQALEEADPDGAVAPYQALTYWSRSNAGVERLAKTAFDGLLLFGGEESVAEYKKDLPAHTQLIDFGPKISFGVVLDGLTEDERREAARGFALDIILWEQRACTSCQNIFVEGDGGDFAQLLFEALEDGARRYPSCRVPIDEAVEIRKERELQQWHAFEGTARVWEGTTGSHTVILGRGRDIIPSPLNRTIYVNAVDRIPDILEGNLRVMRYYMSTVAVAAPEALVQGVVEDFLGLGAMRFCRPGTMGLGRDASAPHDGVHLPLQLVRLVNREDLPRDAFGLDPLPASRRDPLVLARLNRLLAKAQDSPFYRGFHRGVRLPLRNLEEFARLPVLEKHHLEESGPPASWDMLTERGDHGYLFSAGGTTGKLRYVFYSSDEFALSDRIFGQGFRTVGIGPRDTTANLMRAGALWTAFPASNLGLEETGCRILSLPYNQSAGETVAFLRTLEATVFLGVPTALLDLAQEAERTGWDRPVRMIVYAGEHLNPAGREYLRKVFRPDAIRSLGYAAVEVGPIGYQCPFCEGTEHHVFGDFCFVEIEEDREVLVTPLGRTVHPLIRYRIADHAEWVDAPCPCGRSARKLRLLSRSGDFIRLNTNKLEVEEIFPALEPFPELSTVFQVHLANEGTRLVVTFVIETRRDGAACGDATLAAKVMESIERHVAWFGNEVSRHYIATQGTLFRVRLVPPDTLPRVGRTGKIRRIVDERPA